MPRPVKEPDANQLIRAHCIEHRRWQYCFDGPPWRICSHCGFIEYCSQRNIVAFLNQAPPSFSAASLLLAS